MIKLFYLAAMCIALAEGRPAESVPSFTSAAWLKEKFSRLPEWRVAPPVKHYLPDDLYQVINGAASLYLKYHNLGLYFIPLANASGDTATLEIYEQRDALCAFGVLAAQNRDCLKSRPTDRKQCDYNGYTVFTAGRFYAKLYPQSSARDRQLGELASLLQNRLQPEQQNISVFDVFPSEDLVRGSFQYHPSGYLGFKIFPEVLSANYQGKSGGVYTLFFSRDLNRRPLDTLYRQIKQTWRETGILKFHGETKTGRQLFMEDDFQGNIAIAFDSVFLAGVTGTVNQKAALSRLSRFTLHYKQHSR